MSAPTALTERVLITGGTRGFGWALARRMQRTGALVAVCGRSVEAVAAANAHGLTGIVADVEDPGDRRRLIETAADHLGGLTLLVNNAATQTGIRFDADTSAQAEQASLREIRVDLEAPLALTALARPHLEEQSCAGVAFITRALGFAPKQSAPAYCAAKAGLAAFALSLRYQWAKSHPQLSSIRIMLPLVDTDMTRGRGSGKISPEDAAQQAAQAIERGKDEIVIGRARILTTLHHIAPGAAARITRNE